MPTLEVYVATLADTLRVRAAAARQSAQRIRSTQAEPTQQRIRWIERAELLEELARSCTKALHEATDTRAYPPLRDDDPVADPRD